MSGLIAVIDIGKTNAKLILFEDGTGAAVWSDLSKTNTAQNAAHIIDGLREAFEQSSKTK